MQYSVFKMRCLGCSTVFYVGEHEDNYDKCPMSSCTDGYGVDLDEAVYEITVDKTTGDFTVTQKPVNPDVIRIR